MANGKTTRKGNGRGYLWLVKHARHAEIQCLIWPFGTCNGYGVLGHLGETRYAHRVMCEMVHGAPPSAIYEAGHSCGNGHKGCVNPQHVSWRTPSENQRDRAEQGTKNVWGGRGKITHEQAAEIRALKGKLPQREIAEMYGISRSNVSFIHCNKAWTYKRRGTQPSGSRWLARMWVRGDYFSLGSFETEAEAHLVYLRADSRVRAGLPPVTSSVVD